MSSRQAAIAAVLVVAVVGVAAAVLLGGDGGPPPAIGTRPPGGGGATKQPLRPDGPDGPGPGGAGPGGTTPAQGRLDPPPPPPATGTSGPRPVGPGPGGTAVTGPGPIGQRPGGAGTPPPPGEGIEVVLRCVDDQDRPLPGVTIDVRAGSGAPLCTVVSDGQGQARPPAIPRGEAIQGVGRHPLSRETVSFGPLQPANRSVVALRFKRSETGRLRGKVTDEQGKPVRDARLVLIDPKQQGEAHLDGPALGLGMDGTFQATVAAGSYAISAEAPGFCASDRAYATVEAGQDAGPIELVVLRQGTLAGAVRLPPDLAAVLPVQVDLVLEVTRGTERNPYTRVLRRPLDVDGTFRFVVPQCDPGAYRLRLEVQSAGDPQVGPWADARLEPGQTIDTLILVLQETPVAVRGTVRDDRGDPLRGARVSVRGRQVTSDDRGRFVIRGLDPGEVAIEGRAPGHAPAVVNATFEGSELAIDLVLPRTGGVRGLVQDARGPAANVQVLVVQRASSGGFRPFQTGTDAQGGYRLEELPPGSYFVKAGPGADPFDPSGAPTVTVTPGEVVEAAPITLR